jgi:cobalamin biosynthesis protein CobT
MRPPECRRRGHARCADLAPHQSRENRPQSCSDKAQQVGTYLTRACTHNAVRDPEVSDLFAQWRYQFISVVREELGESIAPRGEGRLLDYWSQPLPTRAAKDQEDDAPRGSISSQQEAQESSTEIPEGPQYGTERPWWRREFGV